MSLEEKGAEDLPLDEQEAEGVIGGAAELSGGEGVLRHKTARADTNTPAGPESDPDRYQVFKNNQP